MKKYKCYNKVNVLFCVDIIISFVKQKLTILSGIKTDFTIKDLENISGIKAHTIRIWEKRYNLLEPKRTNTNIRFYDNTNLKKLLNVVLLNKNNYKISKIAKMSEDEVLANSRAIAEESAFKSSSLNALKLSMFQFDKVLFHETFNELSKTKTFRQIFKDVFIPFLEEIGILWHTDTLLPAHEHFMSNLILQKIQSSTEALEVENPKSDITYVLFLPENEIHELGLLYLNYELVLRGCHTIYLGQSLPLDNLSYFFKSNKKICYISSLTIRPFDDKIENYFKEIDRILENTSHTFIASGQRTKKIKDINFTSDIKLYENIPSLLVEL